MDNKYIFHIAKIRSSIFRNEQINVGLIVKPFETNSALKVKVHNFTTKDKASLVGLKVDDVKSMFMEFQLIANYAGVDEAIKASSHSRLHFENGGFFNATDKKSYDENINLLLEKLVFLKTEERKPSKKKVISEVKSYFKKYDLISSNLSDIENHKMVSNYPISEEKGLVTDLILKNGLYSLVETLDINPIQPNSASEKISFKILTVNEARTRYGDNNVDSFFVYSLSHEDEKRLKPQMNLALSYTNNLINLIDEQARISFIRSILNKAGESRANLI